MYARSTHRAIVAPQCVETLDYLSSEMLASCTRHSFSNEEIDVWSLSILIHKLPVGTTPFEDMPATTKRRIAKGNHQMPNFVSTEGKDLTKWMIH